MSASPSVSARADLQTSAGEESARRSLPVCGETAVEHLRSVSAKRQLRTLLLCRSLSEHLDRRFRAGGTEYAVPRLLPRHSGGAAVTAQLVIAKLILCGH